MPLASKPYRFPTPNRRLTEREIDERERNVEWEKRHRDCEDDPCDSCRRSFPASVRSLPLTERLDVLFRRNTTPEPNTGCLLWRGHVTADGYGRTKVKGRTILAHRLAWEHATGTAIPSGLLVLHRCDNPPCVNVDHLFLGTDADNKRDCVMKGRQSRGDRNGNAKLTAKTVAEVRAAIAEGAESLRAIGRRFGVDVNTVIGIRDGTVWAWLKPPQHQHDFCAEPDCPDPAEPDDYLCRKHRAEENRDRMERYYDDVMRSIVRVASGGRLP